MTLVLGIDPGLSAGYAVYGPATQPLLDDIPVHQAQHGRAAKVRAELDIHACAAAWASLPLDHVFIEDISSRPGQSVTAVRRYAYAAGSLYGVVVTLGLPVTLVAPQAWQKYHRIGPSPDAARQKAVQLFPRIAARIARVKDQHRADALLIALYGYAQLDHRTENAA